MELHALDLHLAVAQAHDDAVGRGGGDFEAVGQAFALDDERVVARGGEEEKVTELRQTIEDGL